MAIAWRFSVALAGNLLPARALSRQYTAATGGGWAGAVYWASNAWPLTPLLSGPIR